MNINKDKLWNRLLKEEKELDFVYNTYVKDCALFVETYGLIEAIKIKFW